MLKKILLIDDDLEILLIQQETLLDAGFAVETASGGVEALEQLTRAKYDAIVVDLNMPEIDGFELIRRIKELPPGRDSNKWTPILMVTGTADRDARTRGFAGGVVVFLSKPFSPTTFRRTVEGIVGASSRDPTA